MDRREFLQTSATTLVAASAVALAEVPPGPYSNPTKTFDPHELDTIPGWAFSQPFKHLRTIRPKRVASFEKLEAEKFVFHPSEPIPIGKVYHGTAFEFFNTWPIWKQHFGCDPKLTGSAAWADKVNNFGQFARYDDPNTLIANWGGFPIKCYKVPMREALVKLRPDVGGEARMYTYDGQVPGPLFRHRIGQPTIVRFENLLETETSIHLHGGHTPSHSDGFPSFYVLQGKARDYFYPHNLPMHPKQAEDKDSPTPKRYEPNLKTNALGLVPDMTEAQSTMWYHDHAMDATGYNVSKGLAGMALCYSEPELWLIANNILPGLGKRSCTDPDEKGLAPDKDEHGKPIEDPELPGYYAIGKEPFYNPYYIPLVLQDKIIDPRTGQISFDSQGHNGYLGTTMLVNGVAWPELKVENRKYRFRILDGSNARIFRLRILSEADYLKARDKGMTSEEYNRCAKPFLQIGKDTWLWNFPVQRNSVVLAMANRADIVFDFSERGYSPIKQKQGDQYKTVELEGLSGERVYYLVDTMPQNDGRGPKVKLEDPNDPRMQALPFDTDAFKLTELQKPIPLVRFKVAGKPIAREQEATVGIGIPLIQSRPKIADEEVRVVREFVFERGKGFWMINKRFYDPTIANACTVLGSAEEWVLRNGGGGWWHPIHIHLEAHQLVAYLKDFEADDLPEAGAGAPLKPLAQMTDVSKFIPITELIANHDTQILGPNTAVRIRMRYRTWPGPFVFHCHNVEHEDMRMMFNFEPVPVEGPIEPPTKFDPAKFDPDAAPAARTHGIDLTHDKRIGELPWELYPLPITPVEKAGELLIPPRKPGK